MRKYLSVIFLLLFAMDCSGEEPDTTAKPERPTDAQAEQTKVTPAPEPPATEEQARIIITDFVNQFLTDKTFEDFRGTVHTYPKFTAKSWHVVELVDGRWIARFDPPAGIMIKASVDMYGQNPRVDHYAYAPR